MEIFKNKPMLVIAGVLLFGIVGGIVGVMSAHTDATAQANTTSSSASTPTSLSAIPTTTTAVATATDVTIAVNPTVTSGLPPGRQLDLHGTVKSVDIAQNRFTMTSTTTVVTVEIDAKTQFVGDVRALDGENPGYLVEVHGTVRADGTLLAWQVDTNIGN
jgi:hypothetical protein